jgi:hypothetical protein
MSEHVHLGVRAPRAFANRIDRVRDELSKDFGMKVSRAQAIRFLLDAGLPRTEKRLGLPPHDKSQKAAS